jgi:hypothetical protein
MPNGNDGTPLTYYLFSTVLIAPLLNGGVNPLPVLADQAKSLGTLFSSVGIINFIEVAAFFLVKFHDSLLSP